MSDKVLDKENSAESRKSARLRIGVLTVCIVAAFGVLVMRLFSLQVLSNSSFSEQADKNRMRIISQTSKRGDIFDINMNPLALSMPVFCVSLVGVHADDRETVSTNLAAILQDENITAASITDTLLEHSKRYEPVVIKRLLYDETGLAIISQIEERRDELPGVLITEEPMRYYPGNSLAGHIIGTVGLINSNEVNDLEGYGFLITDWVGKTGVEKSREILEYNNRQIGLHGTNGFQQVEVDAKNYPLNTVHTTSSVSGNSLVLTIDSDVQRAMEQSIESTILSLQADHPKCQIGSAVLLNIDTGAVIAATSYPEINPNDFANGLSNENYGYYMNNPHAPLVNRFTSGVYPPGSTFKMITALAALESGVITATDTVLCNSAAWVAPRTKCAYAHGRVNVTTAIAVSCNTFFQEIGYRTGIKNIYEMGALFGFGARTGIDLPSETPGILPNEDWKKTRYAANNWEYNWHDYDTFFTSIGMGYNSYTVLQLASYIATIANDGNRMQPYITDSIISPETSEVIYKTIPQTDANLGIKSEHLSIIKNAMLSVTSQGGTAYRFFSDFPILVAAKTGTAETGRLGDDEDLDYHGIFVAYAPFDDPEVAFACVIEYGDSGGSSGGLVCRAVFEEYFGFNTAPLPDDLPLLD